MSSRRTFAEALDQARKEQHLTIRQVAQIADVPTATAQGWLNGKHFPVPALRPNYLRMVEGLGLADQLPDDLWDEPLGNVQPQLRTGRPPYLGLRPFGTADRELFFGRHHESHRLAEAAAELRRSDGHGVVPVLGASGSGKSSLLAAGLIGRESTEGALAGWTVAQLSVRELPTAADATADLVVIDQFEELFGLTDDERTRALESLTAIADRSIVVLGLRSDAFAAAAQEPVLADALAKPFLIAPLTRAEAREAIVGPALLAAVAVDDDLVPVLLDDLAPGPSADTIAADVLPLLSNALLVIWAAGKGNRMTLTDYLRAGGVASAVQELAEEVFSSLDEVQQVSAKSLFLRLVRFSDDVVVRESVALDDIDPAGTAAMNAFVAARMLTVRDRSVRISHEALLTHWSRLHDWIHDNRTDLAVLERLRRATQLWVDSDRDPEALIPVGRLGLLDDWLEDTGRQHLLSPGEREFVAASRDYFASALAREQHVSARLRRGSRLAIGLTALVSALAMVIGLFYWQSLGLRAQAEESRLEAQSRQVALEARSIRADDPNLMAQMALVAADLADTRQSQSALLDATSVNTPIRWLGAPGAILAKTADDGVVARANGRGEVTLWRGDELTSGPGVTFSVDPEGGPLYALALTRTGDRVLMAVGGAMSATLWDITAEPTRLADLRDGDATAYGATFSSDGTMLALATSTGEVRLWSVSKDGTPSSTATISLGADTPAKSVAFSRTGDGLFVAGPVNAVARWRLGANPVRLADLGFEYGDSDVASQTLAVSPDGSELAVGIAGRRLLRWRLADGEATALPPLSDFGSWINDLAYSSDGRTLLAANSDQNCYVIDAASGRVVEKLGGATLVTGVELVTGRPVSAGADGTVRVWQAHNPVLRTGSTVYALTTDAGGRFLAASTLQDGINLWNTAGDAPERLPDPAGQRPNMAAAVALAPDGSFLLGATTDGTVLSWALGDPVTTPQVMEAFPGSYIGALAVSPDSSLVAVLQYTGTRVALYRADDSGRLTLLTTLDTPTPQGVTFSPDGGLLAIPIDGGAVQLWDVARPDQARLAGRIENLGALPTIAAFANHSRLLAVGTDSGAVTLWDVADPGAPVKRTQYGDPHAAVYGVSFSPDDQTLVAVGGDQLAWAWDLDRPGSDAYLALDGDLGRTNDVRFISDGDRLVVGGDSGTIRSWLVRPSAAREELCRNRGDSLTDEEWSRYLPGVVVDDPC